MKFNHKVEKLLEAIGMSDEEIQKALDEANECVSTKNTSKAIRNLVESKLTREELCVVLAVVFRNATKEIAERKEREVFGSSFNEFIEKYINPKK